MENLRTELGLLTIGYYGEDWMNPSMKLLSTNKVIAEILIDTATVVAYKEIKLYDDGTIIKDSTYKPIAELVIYEGGEEYPQGATTWLGYDYIDEYELFRTAEKNDLLLEAVEMDEELAEDDSIYFEDMFSDLFED